ncbi:hypothetical protein E2320_002231 [Naja naja]|nr:hypothetical protein E2320_002231 [Naja naja]
MLLWKADINMIKRARELTEDEVKRIPNWFLNRQKDGKDSKDSHVLPNGLDNKLCKDLEHLKKIRVHRGLHHFWGLRVHGQHTKTTGRHSKTMGDFKIPEKFQPAWDRSCQILLIIETAVRTKNKEWIHYKRVKGPVDELKEWKVVPGEDQLRINITKN